MIRRPELAALVARHRALESLLESKRERFLSDWSCDNPLAEGFLGEDLHRLTTATQHADSYIYFDQETSVLDGIRRFHFATEDLLLSRHNILAGPGSSSFLATLAIWLRRSGYQDVYYVPPLYHTLHYLLEALDITATPVAAKHAFEPGFSLALPQKHTALLLCDPVWYAGKRLTDMQVEELSSWQRSTRSLIFVDGSFQYMQWDGSRAERSAQLEPNLTLRLVCPAKALAVPTFRFAYLLHPQEAHDELTFLYESAVGGASASDLAFAHRALEVLNSESANRGLTRFLEQIYFGLLSRGLIETTVAPECGYFVFAALTHQGPDIVTMDGTFFDVHGYTGYSRINLMTARRIYELELLGVGGEPG